MDFIVVLVSIFLASFYILFSGLCASFIADEIEDYESIIALKVVEILIIAYLIYRQL
jgi:uncharacterized membrane protein